MQQVDFGGNRVKDSVSFSKTSGAHNAVHLGQRTQESEEESEFPCNRSLLE